MDPHLRVLALFVCVAAAGCRTIDDAGPTAAQDRVVGFSEGRPGTVAPPGWEPLIVSRSKPATEYRLIRDPAAGVVLRAHARRSASGLKHPLAVDKNRHSRIAWKWRVMRLIDGADNADRHAEDSPVRLLLFFDGDKRSLPLRERISLETAEMLSGHSPPYATLIYVWSNHRPANEVIANGYTGRVKMLVAGSGADRLGQWKNFERDFRRDFKRAFGEEPGNLIGLGVMTDTDNTGSEVEAYYGDIELR